MEENNKRRPLFFSVAGTGSIHPSANLAKMSTSLSLHSMWHEAINS
jgi:hypothetical protein